MVQQAHLIRFGIADPDLNLPRHRITPMRVNGK